ncbi:S8 family serine peptidase [Alteromonas ponticola]|uniref:S8 family serine peptidase n=1 Tax=Alteromonas ponticola TaxID=2720613 RepID=A0ABX1QYE9_9ALTE|nr:S8 family serine peptidase [Alteromonas ponticola]NMH59269.1 S8 family serine peptidase [Alteromonas ponticola]
MFNKFQSFTLLSAGLLSASVAAAVQTPTNQVNDDSAFSLLLQDSLNRVIGANAEQRYIVEFFENEDATQIQSGVTGTAKRFSQAAARSAVAAVQGRTLKVLNKQKIVVAELDKGALAALKKRRDVKRISIDHKRELMAQSTPYGYNMVEADQLVQSDTAAGKVCVIDTGINRGHSDLPDANSGLTGNSNNAQVGNWYNDGHGHGTHVAGTISALDNNVGVVGVYPGVALHVVKIFNDNGDWTYASDLIGAVEQCKDAGANVVNMSLGGSYSSAAERDAMQAFSDDGMLLVAAAGNAGTSAKSYPASYDAVISVAAVQSNGNRASYSQYNNKVELAAPGSSVKSTYPVDRYATMSGTSMATPHVSGAAALLWSFYPQCTNAEIRQALTVTAEDRGSAGRDNYYGYGIVKTKRAYDYLSNQSCAAGSQVEPEPEEPGQGVTQTIENIGSDVRGWVRMPFQVPAGVNSITFRTSGGEGDIAMYIRSGRWPSVSTFDCRSYNEGNSEECTIENPAEDEWWVGLRGKSAFSGVTLTYTIDEAESQGAGGQTEEPISGVTETYENIGSDTRGWVRMPFEVSAGTNRITFSTEGGEGNISMYVRPGRWPSVSTYECRSTDSGNAQTCAIDNPAEGEWWLGLRSKSPFSGVTLTYSNE